MVGETDIMNPRTAIKSTMIGASVLILSAYPACGAGPPLGLRLEVWPESLWPGFALRQADVLQV